VEAALFEAAPDIVEIISETAGTGMEPHESSNLVILK
jgi:hypothetical protein